MSHVRNFSKVESRNKRMWMKKMLCVRALKYDGKKRIDKTMLEKELARMEYLFGAAGNSASCGFVS